jgi:hypothetical protein
MRLRFTEGGPWDGVEFESDFAPMEIGFRDTAIGDIDPKKPLVMPMSERNHHRYVICGTTLKEGVKLVVGENLKREPEEGEDILHLVDSDLLVFEYKYSPGLPEWWGKPL